MITLYYNRDRQSRLSAQRACHVWRDVFSQALSFELVEDAAERGYHIRGQATYGRLLSGVVSVVPPG